MLAQEGQDTNCFLSLVVDTKGTYVAAITRKITTTSTVTINNIQKSYNFFGENTVELNNSEESPTTKTITKEIVEYFNMDIEKPTIADPLEDFNSRFEELSAKSKQTEIIFPKSDSIFDDDDFDSFYINKQYPTYNRKYNSSSQINLWKPDNFTNKTLPTLNTDNNKNSDKKTIDEFVKKSVSRILMCSLFVNDKVVNLNNWVSKHMNSLYKKVFENNNGEFNTSFDIWAEFIIDFVYNSIPENISALDKRGVMTDIKKELNKYKSANKYIQEYINICEYYE